MDEVPILDAKMARLRKELDELYNGCKDDADDRVETDQNCPEVGVKAFTKDLRMRFKGLDDVYVCQALCGEWGGARPSATRFESKVMPVKVSPLVWFILIK